MIDLTADHVGFVLTAYGIAAIVLLVVTGSVLLRARALKKTLAAMQLSDPGQTGKP